MVKSNLRSMDYNPKDVIRIINPKQQLLYVKHGVFPIDIYTSIDDRTGNSLLIMIFLRDETAEVYRKWLNYELS